MAFCLFLTFHTTGAAEVPEVERNALISIFNSTGGENWRNNLGWLDAEGTEHTWYGVRISDSRVAALDLSSNQLVGTLPPEIGFLTGLEELQLGDNQLTGELPAEMGQLGRLKILSLELNELHGNLPEEIGGLTSLEELYLYENHLEGSLPLGFFALPDLKIANFQNNKLSGPLPGAVRGLESLWLLSLTQNQFSGPLPDELSELVHLRHIFLDQNQFSGPLPSTMGDLSSLEILLISNNQLTGSLPENLFSAQNLRVLNLAQNRLQGPLPSNIGSAVLLEALYLGRNQLLGSLPPEVGNLTKLEILSLPSNELNGALPGELFQLDKLHTLELSDNQFSGTIPASISQLERLGVLRLSSNRLEGSLREEIGDLAELRTLQLRSNSLTGPIPQRITELLELRELDLGANRLSGTIPEGLERLVSLQRLNLSKNDLTGTIPESLGSLGALESLQISDNRIGGSLPETIGGLQNLKVLSLHGNELKGPLPNSLGNLSQLRHLSMSHNGLSGQIPEQIGGLTNLRWLYLDNNQLQGQIPSALGNLVQLELLFMGNNALEGSIPSSIGDLSALRLISMEKNQLSGSIPAELSQLVNLRYLSLSENQLSGPLPVGMENLTLLESISIRSNNLQGNVDSLLQLPNLIDGHSDFLWNALEIGSDAAEVFINAKQGGMVLDSQTPASPILELEEVSATALRISWEPVAYLGPDGGGYRILARGVDEENFVPVASVEQDGMEFFDLFDLEPQKQYLLSLQTFTNPHSQNQNTVLSTPSPALTVKTDPVAVFSFPLFLSGNGEFTGLAFTNLSLLPARLELEALQTNGDLFSTGENPSVRHLEPSTQIAVLAGQLFGLDSSESSTGWVKMETDNKKLGSFFQIGSLGLDYLDGSVASVQTSARLFFTSLYHGPEAFLSRNARTRISLANLGETPARILIRYIEGTTTASTQEIEIPALASRFVQLDDILGQDFVASDGYLQVEAEEGSTLAGFGLIDINQSDSLLGAAPWTSPQGSTRYYSAQLAHIPGQMFTLLKLVNLSTEVRQVELRVVDSFGSSPFEDKLIQIQGGQTWASSLEDLFQLTDTFVGSLSLGIDREGIIGDVVFGDPQNHAFAALLKLQSGRFREAVFNQVANLGSFFTGLAFFNPGGMSTTIEISVFDRQGLLVGSTSFELGPEHRVSRVLTQWLPETQGQNGGYVRVRSAEPIVAQQLFGDAITLLSAVPPTIIE